MTIKVYAAAMAVSLRRGQSQQQVWDDLTKVFAVESGGNIGSKTFIYGGYHFEERVKRVSKDDVAGLGDVFKAVTAYGTQIYVTVTEWNPTDSFSYIEQIEGDQLELSPADKTDFNLVAHPEGTVIKIVRREKGDVKNPIREFLAGHKNRASWAAGRLGHVIGGHFLTLGNNESQVLGDFKITRNDSLRNEF
jgi:hypothetical protein